MHLFNYGFTTFNILSAVGGVVYYSMSSECFAIKGCARYKIMMLIMKNKIVLFPTMVATIFETDIIRGGLVSCAVGGGVCAGQVVGAVLAIPGGRLKLKMIFVTAGMMAFLAGIAGATDSETTATVLAVLAGTYRPVTSTLTLLTPLCSR